jgi:hypothetical protein
VDRLSTSVLNFQVRIIREFELQTRVYRHKAACLSIDRALPAHGVDLRLPEEREAVVADVVQLGEGGAVVRAAAVKALSTVCKYSAVECNG